MNVGSVAPWKHINISHKVLIQKTINKRWNVQQKAGKFSKFRQQIKRTQELVISEPVCYMMQNHRD